MNVANTTALFFPLPRPAPAPTRPAPAACRPAAGRRWRGQTGWACGNSTAQLSAVGCGRSSRPPHVEAAATKRARSRSSRSRAHWGRAPSDPPPPRPAAAPAHLPQRVRLAGHEHCDVVVRGLVGVGGAACGGAPGEWEAGRGGGEEQQQLSSSSSIQRKFRPPQQQQK